MKHELKENVEVFIIIVHVLNKISDFSFLYHSRRSLIRSKRIVVVISFKLTLIDKRPWTDFYKINPTYSEF